MLIKLFNVLSVSLDVSLAPLMTFFELPASLSQLLHRPWTMITYMFAHFNFWHVLFNLLFLYSFGRIFLYFFEPKQLYGVYLSGGVAGGVLFVLVYNLFPYFRESAGDTCLIGASASTIAIAFAIAFYQKQLKIKTLLLGKVRLLPIAILFLIIDLLSIENHNPGGHMAHIGGALIGILFGQWMLRHPETDPDSRRSKQELAVELGRILDKLERSGYNSLSEHEKRQLFNASK
jgi:membrane associated rhomboid family serine protease